MTPATLLSDLSARGIEFEAHGDKLRFRPVEKVAADEVELIRQHKRAILGELRAREARFIAACFGFAAPDPPDVDSFPDPPGDPVEEPEYIYWPLSPIPQYAGSPRSLCSPPAKPFDPDRLSRVLDTCDRCGSTQFVDVPIHDGQSTRRDCARCRRFLGWPVWYGRQEP